MRAQSAQAQADQGQAQQQTPYTQDLNMQYQDVQNQHMQGPNTQAQGMQDPNLQHQYMQAPHAQAVNFPNQNPYMQHIPAAQDVYTQHPQISTSYAPNPKDDTSEGDFFFAGHRYNIHTLHQMIDSRHPDTPPPPNRSANAFALSSHGAYGPHNARPAPAPRLGPNGRPMTKLEHFGRRGEWVEMPNPQAYRRENRAERERNMSAQLEFIERNPHRLGPTWNPSWRRW
ncbi:hypothetical protein Q7P35_006697 [Cladosporium inversicolor]